MDELEYLRKLYIRQYLDMGFSVIPVGSDKRPLVRWEEYQKRTPSLNEARSWFGEFGFFNTGIVTGVGGFYSLDIDTKEVYKDLPNEMKKTMVTETLRGFHFNYIYDGELRGMYIVIKGYKFELKGLGQYVLEPYSVISNFEYRTVNRLSEIKKMPNLVLDAIASKLEDRERLHHGDWYYRGDASCIKQILDRDLKEGEREKSLFILFNLLIRSGNKVDYAKSVILRKNHSLTMPLPDSELERTVFNNKRYTKLGCNFIKSNLSYINCAECIFRRRYLKGVNWKDLFLNEKLSNIEKYLIFKFWLEGFDKVSVTELAKEIDPANLNSTRVKVYRSLKKLKELGYLNAECEC